MNVVIGRRYTLHFENSRAGNIECDGAPLILRDVLCVAKCNDYLVFEKETDQCHGVFDFHLHTHEGCDKNTQWWDENYWTQLVSVEEIAAAA